MKNQNFAKRVINYDSSVLAELFIESSNPINTSFAGGYPDQQLFPSAEITTAFQQALTTNTPGIFQYTDAKGPVALRTILAQRHLQRTGVAVTADDLLITQGGQQAIDLITRLFINPGDGLAIEGPTYVGAISAFESYAPTYYEIPMEADGLNVDQLEADLKAHRGANRIKLLYTIPDFQNPTGITLSTAKRQRLAHLAAEYDFYILEDSPYRDLRYRGTELPTIQSFDHHHRVLYVSSFSKILSPGLRVGYLVAEHDMLVELAGLKSANDVQSPNMTMLALAEYLTTNNLDQHIAKMKPIYAEKCHVMVNALRKYMPAEITFTEPEGGFFLWLTGPKKLDLNKFMHDILLPKAHIVFVPSQPQYASSDIRNCARLNYSNVPLEKIEPGIKQLATYFKAYLANN
ncbi:aminotransferase-like domain-containing protein [Periweissella fabalis]|uniref:PLP-dependent aminotransferase family protein n=1 Tax=Periweissella fabalis TaxID=1070421 RepID=A0A7X6N1Y4_9LACO|nr:PLP-dependent aminotransferase family protein [Periweissella fabalis]MCM0598924.1 PLP-dependent aminotransferase family protein [Periweissella fabalis]NKZ23204.1 PLP-dependent aminotransferase family protein [Periweissella fabalis]